jgi:hypothetical protein
MVTVGLVVGLPYMLDNIINNINNLQDQLAETEGFEPSIELYNPITV